MLGVTIAAVGQSAATSTHFEDVNERIKLSDRMAKIDTNADSGISRRIASVEYRTHPQYGPLCPRL